MENLEKLNVNLGKVVLEQRTDITFIMKSGAKFCISTPLSITDFTKIWGSPKRKIKIATGVFDYVFIDKKHVVLYEVNGRDIDSDIGDLFELVSQTLTTIFFIQSKKSLQS